MAQDFKKNIKEYGKEIKTLTSFTEAVRKTPGQYIGYVGNKGFINMIREVLQNSMDELEKDKSPCTEIWTEYREEDNTFICCDNGRGIPFNNIERIFTSEHTSSNFEKAAGEFSSGRHGVGAKVTNALSSEFFVDSYLCKELSPTGKAMHRRMEFYDGAPWKKGEVDLPNKENLQGSRVEFRPCYEIMGKITVTCEDVMRLIGLLLPLMKHGAIINFTGTTITHKKIERRLVNEDGIITFLIQQTQKPVCAPICISGINQEMTMKADMAFTWAADELDNPEWVLSFGNMCPTINESIHVIAFLDAVSNYFRNYMNRIFLGKNAKIQIQNSDVKCGLKAVISAFHILPMFSGQAKEILSNADLGPFIKDLVKHGLDDWMKKNPDSVQRVCKFIKSVAELRLKANKEKIVLLKKSVSVLNGLPSKYAKPTGKKNLELILVEGDSALSSCRTARDTNKQGLFPLRGKVKNAMTCSKKEFFSNEECKAIYTILDCGEGRNCDPDKCKFDKIIFLGDADMDGLHIRTLLLKMFLVYYRPLVEAGKVYAAVPPLYGLKKKNSKMKSIGDVAKNMQYFTNQHDFIQYVYRLFIKENSVLHANKKPFVQKEIVDLLYRNYDYFDNMNILCEDYAADPNLLEFVYSMIVHGKSFKDIQKAVKKVYPFMQVKQDNGILVLDGLVGENVQMLIFNPNMLADCERLIGKFINKDSTEMEFIFNGYKINLYTLMSQFDKTTPTGLNRFKG